MRIDTKSPAYVIAFTAIVAVVFTGTIMVLQVSTAGIVERNERLLRQRALVELFEVGNVADMSDQQIIAAYDKHISEGPTVVDAESGSEFPVLIGRRGEGDDAEIIGYAFPVEGVGFWAKIAGFVRVSPDLQRIRGIVFTEQAETPGLGARITEQAWRERFKDLTAAEPEEGTQFIYIGGDQPGPEDKRYGRYVDSISGATQTAIAVENFLNEDLAAFVRAAKAADLGKADIMTQPGDREPVPQLP
jgi:Na+-transporting NADH:ubiquinone oxidoreductase subunit C